MAEKQETSGADQAHSTRFQKGRSGNPKGRPRGARSARTVMVEAIMSERAEELAQKAVELALDGDTVALRLCLERIAPAPKDRPVNFSLPPIACSADAAQAAARLVAAVTAGELSPSQASDIGKFLENYVRIVDVTEIEAGLAKLEQKRQ